MRFLILYLLAINLLALLLMASDKHRARKGRWRIPEKTLLITGLIGGSLGAYIGMQLFRNKTKHLTFSIGIPLILAAHIVLLVFLIKNQIPL